MKDKNVLKIGRWFFFRQPLVRVIFFVTVLTSLFVATPFTIIHHNVTLSISVALIATAWMVLRCMMRQYKGLSLPELVKTRGIYSVVRFPAFPANIFYVAAISISTGIAWFAIAATVICIGIMMAMAVYLEQSLDCRYSETFVLWRERTSSMIPGWSRLREPLRLVSRQSIAAQRNAILGTTVIFITVNILKNYIVDLRWYVSCDCFIEAVALLFIWGILYFAAQKRISRN